MLVRTLPKHAVLTFSSGQGTVNVSRDQSIGHLAGGWGGGVGGGVGAYFKSTYLLRCFVLYGDLLRNDGVKDRGVKFSRQFIEASDMRAHRSHHGSSWAN
jgi:hypothetical protein